MAKARILIIDDDEEIQDLAKATLEPEGYVITTASNGKLGLRALSTDAAPDLILLDLMMPEMDGLDVCRQIKADEARQRIPIIMLSAKDHEADIVSGLELGADDYITKPFSTRVLVARIHAVLRRRGRPALASDEPVKAHGLTIHAGRHEIRYRGHTINLTPTEFKILQVLAGRPGWVFTRYQIVDAIRGEDFAVTDRSVDVQISALRRKMGEAGALIETVRGIGYRFKD
ncbi:MAG: response regulator transcription factor [Lentisphaerae bacterium]|nr:response regulator transcription factor [Lentisphaerota bacterium]